MTIDLTNVTPYDCNCYILTELDDSFFGSIEGSTTNDKFYLNDQEVNSPPPLPPPPPPVLPPPSSSPLKSRSGKRRRKKQPSSSSLSKNPKKRINNKTLMNPCNIKARERYWNIKAKREMKKNGFTITESRLKQLVDVYRMCYLTKYFYEKKYPNKVTNNASKNTIR